MDITSKRLEVRVRCIKVVYSEETIIMVLGLRNVGNTYQNVLDTSSKGDYDAYMESLCNPGTKWIDCGTNKTVRRIDLCPDSKAWYQFIKHSLRLIAHNEFLSKARFVMLHCII